MEWIQRTFEKPLGKLVLAILIVASGVTLYFEVRASFTSVATGAANDLIYIDSETGGTFHHTPALGETIPVISPLTGRNTGYPAELCYWNKDGTTKIDPTPVLMNSFIGKKEPTFCPDCGRLVVPGSQAPTEGAKPPPTRAEWGSLSKAAQQNLMSPPR